MIFRKNSPSDNIDHRLPQLFSALSDPRRYQIVKTLLDRSDLSVSQIAKAFRISVSAASQQLKILEMTGVVKRVRIGQMICYEINDKDPMVNNILSIML